MSESKRVPTHIEAKARFLWLSSVSLCIFFRRSGGARNPCYRLTSFQGDFT